MNVINNYYRPGPCTKDCSVQPLRIKDHNTTKAKGFVQGNYFDGMLETFNLDNFTAVEYTNTGKYMSTSRDHWELKSEIDCGEFSVPTQTANDTYTSCLKYSGCSLIRDTVDERIIANIVAKKGTLIDSQNQIGGWDSYPMERRFSDWDLDRDGVPDSWERAKGLNPEDPNDGIGDRDDDGYTNLEEYINSLVPVVPLVK